MGDVSQINLSDILFFRMTLPSSPAVNKEGWQTNERNVLKTSFGHFSGEQTVLIIFTVTQKSLTVIQKQECVQRTRMTTCTIIFYIVSGP